MKLVYPDIETHLVFEEGSFPALIIENQNLFSTLLTISAAKSTANLAMPYYLLTIPRYLYPAISTCSPTFFHLKSTAKIY